MGEQSSQRVDERRAEAVADASTEPAEVDQAYGEVGAGVIDLRSPPGDGPAPVAPDPGDLASADWSLDQSGWRLRMATSPGQVVDVRLPRTFGPLGGGDPALDRGDDRARTNGQPGDLVDHEDGAAVEGVQHLAVHALEPSGWPAAMARAADLVEISRPTPVSRRASVGEVLSIHLQDQCTELLANEGGVRAGVGESVHRMRVATRRLRSLLATYRPWLTGSRGERLRGDLRYLAEDLGRARDIDVLHARLDQEIAALPEELVVGPVVARVDRQLRARQRAAFDAIWADLDGERYQRLIEQLDRLAKDPPLSSHATRRARAVLGVRIAEDGRRVREAHDAYARVQDSGRGEALLHEVRKAAKRARYAAESAEPVLGKPAARMARRMQKVQQVLGENQDSAAARLLIRHLVFQAHLAGENCFTFGLVYGMEMARASEARTAAEPAIRSALDAAEVLAKR